MSIHNSLGTGAASRPGARFSNPRIRALIRKEVWHIMRDWQTLLIVLAMPVFMMFLYGYALDVNINDVEVMVEDPSPTPETAQLIRAIDHSSLFKVKGVVNSVGNPDDLFKKSHVKALFRLSPSFTRDLLRPGSPASIQVLIDGSDQNLGTVLRNVTEPFLQKAVLSLLNVPVPVTIDVRQTILYNPQQKSALYFVPGLMVIILMMISALLTSLTITREKEQGSLEQMLVSPIRPAEILIGKIAPYVVLAAIDGALILLVGYFVFGVSISGSLTLLSVASLIYIFAALSLGLLISTISKKQEHAMLIVLPATVLPTVLLSGFIFPIASLPVWLQLLSMAIPATYFLEIIRGIILKGVGLAELWRPMLVLGCMGLFLLAVSVRKFRVRA
jgi:ABC-2 type transport system permease protein